MPTVLEVNCIEDLAAYKLAWDAQLAVTRQPSFFQSLDWLTAYWRHYGSAQKLRVLLVEQDGKLLGILPLVVRDEPTRIGQVRVLTYPLHDWGAFYGPIGANPTATLMCGMAHLRSTARDWDLLDLRWVDRDCRDRGRTLQAMRGAGWRTDEQPLLDSAIVDTSGPWANYWQERGSHWRNNVGRSERRLAELGKVTYLRYRPAGAARGESDPRWDLYDACEQLANKSWQGSSTTGTTLSHASVQAYLRDAHQAAAHAGGLDLNLLLVNGRPIAFAYNNYCQGYVYGLRMGYDPQVSREGAGTVLFRRMIGDAFERGDHTFDLGPGALECKRHWQTSVRTSYRYTHYPLLKVRAQLLRAKRRLAGRLGLSRAAVTKG